MRVSEIIFLSFFVSIEGGHVKKVDERDINRACIIRFLQIKGKLEQGFQSSLAPPNLCRILLPLIYANHSEKLCLRLWETKSVKADCVFEKLKNSEIIDLELKIEIYSQSKHLTKTEKNETIQAITKAQRDILISAAKVCKSDSTYGGLFDEVLGINSSLIIMNEKFCLLKYVLENKFIFVSSVNINPRTVHVSPADCLSVISKRKEENEEKLYEAFRKRKYSSEAISCLLSKHNEENIFGWNLAKDFLFKLNLSDSVTRAEDWRISKILSDFNKKSSNCLYSFNWTLF